MKSNIQKLSVVILLALSALLDSVSNLSSLNNDLSEIDEISIAGDGTGTCISRGKV